MDRRQFLNRFGTLAVFPFVASLDWAFPSSCQVHDSRTRLPAGNKISGQMNPGEITSKIITPPHEYATPAPAPEDKIGQVSFMAAGDIMTHLSVIKYANIPGTDDYDFDPYFEHIAPILRKSDWVFGNLETRLAGKKHGYTGYPMFNAPESMAFALKRAGFTVLSTANNHTLDRWKEGIIKTNQVLDQTGLIHTGTFSSTQDRDTIRVLKKNNVSMAVLAYTYGTNGLPIPKGEEYLVNLIDLKKIELDVIAAKKLGVDFICCSLHYGPEYQRVPDNYQKEVTAKVLSFGVDIILGHHPHVVQPYQILTDGKTRKVVIYSLGNFLADQGVLFTCLGLILKMKLVKNAAGEKSITDIELLPTWVMPLIKNGRKTMRIYSINDVVTNKNHYGLPENLWTQFQTNGQAMEKHLKSLTS